MKSKYLLVIQNILLILLGIIGFFIFNKKFLSIYILILSIIWVMIAIPDIIKNFKK